MRLNGMGGSRERKRERVTKKTVVLVLGCPIMAHLNSVYYLCA